MTEQQERALKLATSKEEGWVLQVNGNYSIKIRN